MTTHLHVFDPVLANANRWLVEIADTLGISLLEERRALHALRAGLHAIRDRLPANEVMDLGAQLPTLIRGIYYEGWTRRHDPTTIRDRAEMLARVESELGADTNLTPIDVLGAVVRLLMKHVSAGEIRDIVATLPRPIAELWQEVTANALDVLDTKQTKHLRVERTGYQR